MSKDSSVVAVFRLHGEADSAVKALDHAGFDLKTLSIIARDYHTEEQVVGYYNSGDRMRYWGKQGAIWGGLWGVLFGSALFWVPGLGPLVVAGPLTSWIVAVLESAAIVGGLSVVGAGLYSIGIPKDSVIEYEAAIKAGKFLLIASGAPSEISRAQDILLAAGPELMMQHRLNKPGEKKERWNELNGAVGLRV